MPAVEDFSNDDEDMGKSATAFAQESQDVEEVEDRSTTTVEIQSDVQNEDKFEAEEEKLEEDNVLQ